MATWQVVCIKRLSQTTDPYKLLTHFGVNVPRGTQWISTEEIIQHLQSGKHDYFVSKNGKHLVIELARHEGEWYIRTSADANEPFTLIDFPDCGEGAEFNP